MQRLELGAACEIAMKAANCAAAAATDSVLREHYRDCDRERTRAHMWDTILGCADGLGQAATLPIKALVGGIASFYGHFAANAAARSEAIRTCYSSPDCRDKVASQSPRPTSSQATMAEFEGAWRLAERENSVQNLELQRRSLATQRDLVMKGLRPGTPGSNRRPNR